MHILITDDMITSRIQISVAVKSMGYTYREAANGNEAIKKLNEESFDLILMDIEMPVMNGLETTRYIRKHLSDPKKRNIPILAITAHEWDDISTQWESTGFSGFISKPISPEKLSAAMQALGIK